MNIMIEMLSYPFMVRAFTVGILVSLCSALLGVSLVLKRYSMIGDGLSHVGFGALAVAAALNVAPLAVAIPVVIIAAILLLRVNSSSVLKGDSAIALIYQCTCNRCYGNIHDNRNEYRCLQLHVWKYSGNECRGCPHECDFIGSRIIVVYIFL